MEWKVKGAKKRILAIERETPWANIPPRSKLARKEKANPNPTRYPPQLLAPVKLE
jgi:hypothetical protein